MSKEPSPSRGQQERLVWLVVSGLLALPLLSNVIATAFGFEIFYLADAKLQVVWGTLAQFPGGWGLYRMAAAYLRRDNSPRVAASRPGRGGAARVFWLCLLATVVYAVSLYTALVYPGTGQLFLGSAALVFVAYLVAYRGPAGEAS